VKAQGLWGAFLDPKLGGRGFGQLKLALMSEIIGRCMMSMTIFGVQAPDSGNMELLAHGATDAQKERWLWPNLRGEISSAFALTEPFFAGADPTVIGTTAVKDGDEWVINGRKWFITNASTADIVLVFAETNPDGRPHRHASVFVVPTGTPGMQIVRDIGTMAHPDVEYGRVGNHAEIVFDNCRVPADHLIGEPGEGFVLAQQRLGGGRIHHAMRWLGQAQRSLDIMCERAVSRMSHGKLLAQHQMVRAVAHGDPVRPAAHLPDRVEDGQVRRRRGARRSRDDQGPRLESRARRARPDHPGVRRARLLERPAGRSVVPVDTVRPDR
jgi:acyl-CoA dehydrogenase